MVITCCFIRTFYDAVRQLMCNYVGRMHGHVRQKSVQNCRLTLDICQTLQIDVSGRVMAD